MKTLGLICSIALIAFTSIGCERPPPVGKIVQLSNGATFQYLQDPQSPSSSIGAFVLTDKINGVICYGTSFRDAISCVPLRTAKDAN